MDFLIFDFGEFFIDSWLVVDKMGDVLWWIMMMNFLAIFIVYFLLVLIGVFLVVWKDSMFDCVIILLFFVLYLLLNFWIVMMLVVFFIMLEYGMDWFLFLGLGDLLFDVLFW